MALNTTLHVDVAAAYSRPSDQGALRHDHKIAVDLTWPTGTAVSQADEVWSDRRSLAVGGESLELDNLSQLDDAAAVLRQLHRSRRLRDAAHRPGRPRV